MLLLSLAALVPNWPMGGAGNRLHGAAQEGNLSLCHDYCVQYYMAFVSMS